MISPAGILIYHTLFGGDQKLIHQIGGGGADIALPGVDAL
jgi:hypothetical protein